MICVNRKRNCVRQARCLLWDLSYNSVVASCGMELNRVKSGFNFIHVATKLWKFLHGESRIFPRKSKSYVFCRSDGLCRPIKHLACQTG